MVFLALAILQPSFPLQLVLDQFLEGLQQLLYSQFDLDFLVHLFEVEELLVAHFHLLERLSCLRLEFH